MSAAPDYRTVSADAIRAAAWLAPWHEHPAKLLSWLDMQKFSAEIFYLIGRFLEQATHGEVVSIAPLQRLTYDNAEIGQRRAEFLKQLIEAVGRHCNKIGLRQSSKKCDSILKHQVSPTACNGDVSRFIQELNWLIKSEMEQNLFLFIPSERASAYNQPELLGKEVSARFPNLQFDIVEAGNCYATGRSTGAVFHLMRIMETGVQELGKKLGVALVGEKNWQNILDEVNKKIKALPPKNPSTVALSEAAANLYAVKLAWRNEVMHPKDTYTSEEADNLIQQVRIFMTNLATMV